MNSAQEAPNIRTKKQHCYISYENSEHSIFSENFAVECFFQNYGGLKWHFLGGGKNSASLFYLFFFCCFSWSPESCFRNWPLRSSSPLWPGQPRGRGPRNSMIQQNSLQNYYDTLITPQTSKIFSLVQSTHTLHHHLTFSLCKNTSQ